MAVKSTSQWRPYAARVISKVIKDNEDKDEKTIRKAISEAYPFGQRAMHPYKIWLDEIKIQLGKKRRKPVFNDPTQINLFGV